MKILTPFRVILFPRDFCDKTSGTSFILLRCQTPAEIHESAEKRLFTETTFQILRGLTPLFFICQPDGLSQHARAVAFAALHVTDESLLVLLPCELN